MNENKYLIFDSIDENNAMMFLMGLLVKLKN